LEILRTVAESAIPLSTIDGGRFPDALHKVDRIKPTCNAISDPFPNTHHPIPFTHVGILATFGSMPSELGERLCRLACLHNRLLISCALGETGVASRDLLQEIECDRTTLYRLGRDLKSMGAPLSYGRKVHLWNYAREWNPPWTWSRSFAGATGMRLAMNYLLDPGLGKAMGDLAIVSHTVEGKVSALPRLTGTFPPELPPILSRALREKRKLSFLYTKPGSSAEPKTVHPHSLFSWDGMVYLQAVDDADPSRILRRYALSRMSKALVSPERSRRIPAKDVPSCLGAFTGPHLRACIHADPSCAPYVRERQWHPDQVVRDLPDGSVEFMLPFGDVDEAARWILGRGPGFCPVKPASLVKAWKVAVGRLMERAPTL